MYYEVKKMNNQIIPKENNLFNNNYDNSITLDIAKRRGILFEELIKRI